MRVEIMVPENYLSAIMKDLPRRRAEIKHIDAYKQNKVRALQFSFSIGKN